jgi:SAM-dependent methyltransferase
MAHRLLGEDRMNVDHVHGYSAEESARLTDQATTLTDLLHADTLYPPGSLVLEAGCGAGAQTVILAGNSPEASFNSIGISGESPAEARRRVREAGFTNATFHHADIFGLPFPSDHFDHVFACFVLKHISDPAGALESFMGVPKTGGSITVIEGDHGSAYFHPDSDHARRPGADGRGEPGGRDQGSASNGARRRDVLLHVLQSGGGEVRGALRSAR